MKKAAVLISIGTSHADAGKNSIGRIYRDIQAVSQNDFLEQAYMSGRILRILAGQNIHVHTVEEAVDHAREIGAECLCVIPTHMIPGLSYCRMREMLEQYHEDFREIRVATPVLHTKEDCGSLVPILKEIYRFSNAYEYVLMGHGSEEEANLRYVQMNQAFAEAGLLNVRIASAKAKSDLEDIVEAFRSRGNRNKVMLYPFMVAAGYHAQKDMAGGKDSYASRLREAGYEVEVHNRGLGEYPQFRKIYVDKYLDISID